MMFARCGFWICFFLIVHTYIFYPVGLFLAYAFAQVRRDWRYLNDRRGRRAPSPPVDQLPAVTLIVPAYNEQECLPAKIADLLRINYPGEKLEVVFVSDGSTDGTSETLQALRQSNVRTIVLPERKGKSNALNIAVTCAQNDILIFSDASSLFAPGAVTNLVRHFSDPEVGVVCGAVELFERTTESEQTEGVYWKYESMLRMMEARLGATLTASGAIYAIRRECYRPLLAEDLIDDFLIPMNARRLGYRVLLDPEAVATEVAASSIAGEFTRRARLAVGSFRALGELNRIMRGSAVWIAFLSHKLLRWIAPFLLMGLMASNVFLLGRPLYRLTFVGQLLFYLWAAIGFFLRHRIERVRFALVGYFLLMMNVAFLVGFWRYLSGRGDSAWQRVN